MLKIPQYYAHRTMLHKFNVSFLRYTIIIVKSLVAKCLANKDFRKFDGKKLWRNEVHLHRECYGNSENWQKTLANCCNSPNSLQFFTVRYI